MLPNEEMRFTADFMKFLMRERSEYIRLYCIYGTKIPLPDGRGGSDCRQSVPLSSRLRAVQRSRDEVKDLYALDLQGFKVLRFAQDDRYSSGWGIFGVFLYGLGRLNLIRL